MLPKRISFYVKVRSMFIIGKLVTIALNCSISDSSGAVESWKANFAISCALCSFTPARIRTSKSPDSTKSLWSVLWFSKDKIIKKKQPTKNRILKNILKDISLGRLSFAGFFVLGDCAGVINLNVILFSWPPPYSKNIFLVKIFRRENKNRKVKT